MSKNNILFAFLLLSLGLNDHCRESIAQESELLEGTVLTSSGEPADDALVFGTSDQDATDGPRLLLNNLPQFDPVISPNKLPNAPLRMFAAPTDKNGQAVTEESKQQHAIHGAKLFKTDSDGKFKYSSARTSFFIQSRDGTEVAFVPPGATFPIRLKKCAKLKIDNSVLARNKLHGLGKASITIVWKNCLAGSYPLLYPPNSIFESNPDLLPMDWRIYPYFEFVTYVEDIDLSLECNLELLLPPGEVSVSVLTDKQRTKLEKFNPTILKSRRHFPATSGLVTISDDSPVKVPLNVGVCIRGKIVEQKNASSPLPDWAPGNRNYMMRFRETPAATVSYPSTGKEKTTFAVRYRRFQNSVPQIVKKLTSRPDGFNFRQQNQTGVIATMFERDGDFISVPLPNGAYYGDVTRWNRDESDQSSTSKKGFQKAIPPGHKVISIKLRADDLITDLLGEGDYVDLIWTDSKTPSFPTATVLEQVRVFSVPTSSSSSEYTSKHAVVSLLVNAKQAATVREVNGSGAFRLVLRNPEEHNQTEVAFDRGNRSGESTKCILQSTLFMASTEERNASPKLQQDAAKFSGGYLATRSIDGNAVFRTEPNTPFFHAGEFIAVPADDVAKADVSRWRTAGNSDGDDEVATDLESVVARQFDMRMTQRLRELDELESSLEAARKKLSLRQLQRDEIIKKRVKKLISQKEESDTVDPFETTSKVSTANTEIKMLMSVCIAYKLQVGQYPASLDHLMKKPAELSSNEWGGPYLLQPIANDPWNAPYELAGVLTTPGRAEGVAITSHGPDGKPGTDDDISSTQLDR